MYNTDIPTRAELPSTGKLLRSTLMAFVIAVTLLITVVLPAEYAIDPTGAGRLLGLTEMGEIKIQLAEEAELDQANDQASAQQVPQPTAPQESASDNQLTATNTAEPQTSSVAPDQDVLAVADIAEQEQKIVQPDASVAPAEALATEEAASQATPAEEASPWRDEVSFTLTPGEGTEYKLTMQEGAVATFAWASEGGPVNFDTHGDGNGNSISYEKGRGVPDDEGELEAAFTGNHGWFFRNRNDNDVTVVLRVGGDYGELNKVL